MAITFVRDQLKDLIINAAKLDSDAVEEAKVLDGAIAFAKLKGGDIETDLSTSASDSKIARADAIKAYVDSEVAGISGSSWKKAVRVSTTAQLTGAYNNGSSGVGATITNSGAQAALQLDGKTLVQNDRVLVRHGVSGLSGTENAGNGIYKVTTVGDGSSNWVLTRVTDMDAASEILSAVVMVEEGTANYGRQFFVPSFAGTIGSDNIVFERSRQFSAGDGLEYATANGPQDALKLDIAASKAIQIVSAELDLVLDGSTMAQGASGLKVADAGITATQVATSIAGDGITGGAGTALSVDLKSNAGLGFDTAELEIKLKAETGGTISVDANGLYIADSAIANDKLQNATISGVALGANLNALSAAATGGIVMTSYNGSAAVADITLDLNSLSAATVNVGADSIAIYDADADTTAKETIADLAAAQAGNGIAATSGAFSIQLDGATLSLSASGVKIADSGVDTGQLADDAVDLQKLGILPSMDDFTVSNSSTSTFTLQNRIPAALVGDFAMGVRVFRNGQRLKIVESSPSDVSEYTVTDNGSATIVTLGANAENGDVFLIDYWYNAS